MSGGVDSSLSAALLAEQGCEIVGCFLKNWSETKDEQGHCAWKQERRDALAVAAALGIPLVTVDAEAVYRAAVVEPLYAEYAAGRTPNPDVRCNEFVKFPALAAEADRLGCRWIATGHYARVHHGESESALLMAADREKDQTYFLCRLPQALLARTLFPIGHLTKAQVRDEARRRGLPTAEKDESMGICFVGKVSLPNFLRQRIPDAPGEIVTADGTVVGRHDGVHRFTVGQRHGLGVGGGAPWYVLATDPVTRRVTVAREAALSAEATTVADLRWIGAAPAFPATFGVRIRHRQAIVPATVEEALRHAPSSDGVRSGNLQIRFSTPVRAVTPGQTAAFYDGETCLGGGTLISVAP